MVQSSNFNLCAHSTDDVDNAQMFTFFHMCLHRLDMVGKIFGILKIPLICTNSYVEFLVLFEQNLSMQEKNPSFAKYDGM